MAMRKGLPAKLAATDADDTRWNFRNLVVCNADGSPRGGVTSPVGASLLSSTSTMNVAVAGFSAVAVRDAGVVLLANDGVTNVLLDPPPSSQSRLDVVWAKQDDSSLTVSVPDADNLPTFGVLKGAASASPVRNPAGLPSGAVEIGTVLVPSGATATNSPGVVITTTAQYTAGAGGSVPFRTKAELLLWTTAGPGQHAYVFGDGTAANNGEYVWAGSWSSYFGTIEYQLTMTGIYGLGSPPGLAYTQGGRGFLEGFITNTSGASFDVQTFNFATIPAAIRPATDQWFPLNWGDNGGGGLVVHSNGNLGFQLSKDAGFLGAGVLRLSLGGASWRLKNT